jgi:hypothetical protein
MSKKNQEMHMAASYELRRLIAFSEDWYKDNPEVNKNNRNKKQRRK